MSEDDTLFIWHSKTTPKTHIGFAYPFCGGSKALFPKEEMTSIFGNWCRRCLEVAVRKGLIDLEEVREIASITPFYGAIWIKRR